LDNYGEHYFQDAGDFIEHMSFSREELGKLIAALKIEDIEYHLRPFLHDLQNTTQLFISSLSPLRASVSSDLPNPQSSPNCYFYY
jgi:hypothetical protein